MAVLMFSLTYKKELRDEWHKIWYALAIDVTDKAQGNQNKPTYKPKTSVLLKITKMNFYTE